MQGCNSDSAETMNALKMKWGLVPLLLHFLGKKKLRKPQLLLTIKMVNKFQDKTKTAITTILTLILTISVYGNDGVYLTRGGVIYPTKESKISLDREVLSFSVQDKICRVDILFEFNNTENVERKLMIGFQAPTAVGDVSDNISNTNQIADFKILANGQILPYSLKAAECEDCELKEPKDF